MAEDSDRYPTLCEWVAFHNLPLKPAYTVAEVARMFGVSTRTVQQWIVDGQIKTRKVPGRSKIFASHLEDVLSDQTKETGEQEKKDVPKAADEDNTPSRFSGGAR